MLSRVADCAYWMSRYLERAEHAARLGTVCLSLTLDRSSDTAQRLLKTMGTPPTGYGFTPPAPGTLTSETVQRDTIATCVAAARENARQVREQISSEMWEQINSIYLHVRRERSEEYESSDMLEFFRTVTEASHLFQGLTDATMTHGEGWHFIQIGRYIERAATTATMLEMHFADGAFSTGDGRQALGEYVTWVGLLRSCAAFEAYCRNYTADVRPQRVAEFLLLHAECPRSVRFAVDRVEVSLRAIARQLGRSAAGRVDRLAGRLRASLDFSQIDEIMADSLQGYAQGIRRQCEQVHSALYQTYITYSIDSAIAS